MFWRRVQEWYRENREIDREIDKSLGRMVYPNGDHSFEESVEKEIRESVDDYC
tara:strand:+ start:1297 stop:1455 length:159 start_codon:yes stop_codon:yes gene_type:complete